MRKLMTADRLLAEGKGTAAVCREPGSPGPPNHRGLTSSLALRRPISTASHQCCDAFGRVQLSGRVVSAKYVDGNLTSGT